jgi:hypothetical protein
MRNDKHLAIKLRRKGKSYNKISKELNIPKSTLSDWFSNLRWSQTIKKELERKANYIARKRLRLICKARREYWEKWREEFRKEARKEFPVLKSNPLFIAGLMIYWGEGDSSLRHQVRLSNSDPKMIKLFNGFLQKICKIPKEKIRLSLIIYPDLADRVCKKFWSTKTKISLNQFDKSNIIYGRHPTKRLENGVCIIRVNGTPDLKEKIITWTTLMVNELNKPMIN